MTTPDLERLQLEFNPFEPSATGTPFWGELLPPDDLAQRTEDLLNLQQSGEGAKALVVLGEYGAGKTCLLQWLHRKVFPPRQVKSFYFGNPGVQFYSLANELLREIGRKNFAKFIWELAGSNVKLPIQRGFFEKGFEEYLFAANRRVPRADMTSAVQDAILETSITSDEEIAHCFARIVTDIRNKPYFEYQDFVPRRSGSMVPEGEEPRYFRAILKAISHGTGAKAVAFLIDEFEEIGLQKRLTKRAAHDYLATLKRLINLSQSDQADFWIVLSMTPEAYQTTTELEPSLAERFSEQTVKVEPLTIEEAIGVLQRRIAAARPEDKDTQESRDSLFPFPSDMMFRPDTYSNPRRLIKACSLAIGRANEEVSLPFAREFLHAIEEELFPSLSDKS